MKNLFKVLSVLLVLGLALAACTSAAPETSEPAVEDEVLQVAFVTPSTINDLAFSQSISDAMMVLKGEMGDKLEYV